MSKGNPAVSKYRLETTSTIVKNGVEYTGCIDKEVNIDFSAANYTVRVQRDEREGYRAEIVFIPDSMNFLREVTDIFPLSDYDIKIVQYAIYTKKVAVEHVSLYLDIRSRESGEKVFLPEPAVLSDKDYDYIRSILVKEAGQFRWQTAEEYLCGDIRSLLFDFTTEEIGRAHV